MAADRENVALFTRAGNGVGAGNIHGTGRPVGRKGPFAPRSASIGYATTAARASVAVECTRFTAQRSAVARDVAAGRNRDPGTQNHRPQRNILRAIVTTTDLLRLGCLNVGVGVDIQRAAGNASNSISTTQNYVITILFRTVH